MDTPERHTEPEYLNQKQAAQRVGLSRETLRVVRSPDRPEYDPTFPKSHRQDRLLSFKTAEIDAWFEGRRKAGRKVAS